MRDKSLESRPSAGHGEHVSGAAASPTRALVLATVSFTLSFAAWGLIGGLASIFTGLYKLSASQTALLVAVPVLLGSLARLPMGMLTDRFGGRLVFTTLLAFSSLAAFVVPLTDSFASLLRGRRSASTAWGRWGNRWPSSSARWWQLAWAGKRCSGARVRSSLVGRLRTSCSRGIPRMPGVRPRLPR